MLGAWGLYLLLLAVMACGLILVLWNLPGLWVMFLAATAFMWVTHRSFLGWKAWIVLGLIALLGDIIEFFASSAGARRAGAGRGGLWGAIIGGIVGGIFFTGLIPIPVVGTIAGICFGTFLGAVLGELTSGKQVGHSLRVGAGAAKGRFLGTMSKLLMGIVLFMVAAWSALPLHGSANVSPSVSPGPATRPATALPSYWRST